jgi:hypothetical protein
MQKGLASMFEASPSFSNCDFLRYGLIGNGAFRMI